MKFGLVFAFILCFNLVYGDFLHRLGCGLHKFGNSIIHHNHHHHDPCGEKPQIEGVTEIANNEWELTTYPQIDVRNGGDDTSSTPEVATVPGGKRLINVRANCENGFIADGKGGCRESF